MKRAAGGAEARYEMMTRESIPKLIARLSVPTILSMLISNIYNLVDTAFVGQLGTSQSAAIGVVFGFMAIIQAVGFLFGQGAGSISARLLGARDEEGASRVASSGVVCSFGLGVVISVVAACFIDPIIRLLGSTETIAPYAKQYMTYILIAAPAMTCSYTMNNLLRYEGKASLGMVGMMIGAILNIALDPLLMFAMDMGIAGAAIATASSQIISFFILMSMYLRRKTTIQVSPRKADFHIKTIGDITTTGMPSLLRQVLNSLATILLNSSAAPYGDEAVAAMSIVARVSFFVFALALGIGQGFQPVAAFNYGAKKYARLRKAFNVTVIMAESILIIMAGAGLIFSGQLIGLFRDDPKVIEIGTRALQLQFVTLVFLPFTMAAEMLYQSTGHRIGAALMSAARSGLFFIPSLLILSAVRGLAGIQEAQPLAYVLSFPMALFYVIRFWKLVPSTDQEDSSRI
mgnify:CR=1 FL=1